MSAPKGIILEGWLYLRLDVAGSLDTWNKRWVVLTLRELMCYKNNHVRSSSLSPFQIPRRAEEGELELIRGACMQYASLLKSVNAATIEEMVYGTHVMEKPFGFSIIFGANSINLAASSDKGESSSSFFPRLSPRASPRLITSLRNTPTEREEGVMALKDIVPRAKIRRQAEKIVEKQEATLRRTTTQV